MKACAFYLVVNGCLCTVGAQLVNNSRWVGCLGVYRPFETAQTSGV